MYDLHGTTAIVTGGAQGIGRSICQHMANSQANVVVADIKLEEAKKVAEQIKEEGGQAIAVPIDVTDLKSIREGVDSIIKQFKQIDILINNAAYSFPDPLSPEVFDRCSDVNIKGVWQISDVVTPYLKKSPQGKIVNISSICGRQGFQPENMAYHASKAALINLTQSQAVLLGPDKINVNCVCPGAVITDSPERLEIMEKNGGDLEFKAYAEAYTQLKRAVLPEDIGNAVVFLCSSQAKNITGQSINVDSGHFMN